MCSFVITAVALHYRSVMFSNNRFPRRFEPFCGCGRVEIKVGERGGKKEEEGEDNLLVPSRY